MAEQRLIHPGWTKRIDHGGRRAALGERYSPDLGHVYSLHYPDGSIRIEHTCKRVGDDQLFTAPALQLDGGHMVQQEDPLTITPSILCEDCGLHGWITNGHWL